MPVPATDEFGVSLAIANRPIVRDPAADYWSAEPYTTTNHTNADYYWSPHAEAVFAINPGLSQVVWRRAASSTSPATRRPAWAW